MRAASLRNITPADHLPMIVETARRADGAARKSAKISWSTRVAVPKCGMRRDLIAHAQPGDHAQVIDVIGDGMNPLGRRDQFRSPRALTPVKARGVAAYCRQPGFTYHFVMVVDRVCHTEIRGG